MEGESSVALEVTWGRTLSVWWAFLWRLGLLGGLGGGLVAGVTGVMFAVVIGVSVANVVAKVAFACAAVGSSILVMRGLLSADLGEFSIRLVANDKGRGP